MKTASFAIFIVSSFVGEKYGKLLENVAMDSNGASRSAATTAKSLRDALRVLNVSGWPEQPQIAGVADDAIDAAGDQCMPGLDGDQPAEPMPKDKDGPKPERTTGNEERDTNPASCVAVDHPQLLPIRVGWQIRVQQAEQRKGDEDPAVATILAYTLAQISAREERCPSHYENSNRERDESPVGEKGSGPAPAEHGQAKIGSGAYNDERQSS